MKALKVRNSLMCEYVALGNRNKHTLVNTYTGNILVRNFPARINAGFYIEIEPDRGASTTIHLHVLINDEAMAEILVELNDLAVEAKSGLIAIPSIPLEFGGPCELKLVATGEGYRRTTLLTKSIMLGAITDSTASPLPSEQSPPDAPPS